MRIAEESRYGNRLAMAAIVAVAGLAWAGTEAGAQVIRANRLVVHVTTAYDPCTAPDTVTDGTGTPACTAPLASDAACRLGVRGRGKVQLRANADDTKVLARMEGVDPACEGEDLQFRMSFRVTSNDCGGLTCTSTDFVDQVMGTCQVSSGNCKLVTTLNSALPNLITPTNQTHVEVLGCDFKRTTGPSLPARTFACGIMVP